MKHMKRLASLLMALVMALTLAVPAMAAETGSITINGVSTDQSSVYAIYKLLDLESYDVAAGAYSYKVNSSWSAFFATAEALDYVAIDSDGYVTWKAADDDDTVAAFAKKALAYAKDNDIAAVQSSANEGEFVITPASDETPASGKFSNLPLGYYLVDSTVGALCGLTTTNPNASINAKNGAPTIDKQVKEDSTGNWGDSNTADIGQIVEFRTTINVHAGAQNYVLHDTMSEGLTFQEVTMIEHVIPSVNTNTVGDNMYTVVKPGGCGDKDCTFEVKFSEAFCDGLETNDKVIVYYTAMLNRNAVIAGDGNPNETHLSYGENNHVTNTDQTKTYTFGIDIVKTDNSNKLIDGAEFKIYDAATDGKEVPVVLMDDGVTYRRARADETGVSIVVKDGQVRVVGFDNGTYFLEETVAPDGYNKLTARQKFIISDANLDAVFNGEVFSTGSGVHVVNKTGSMLPETGGMGTTLFYLAGGLLVIGAGVALVTKKRMG